MEVTVAALVSHTVLGKAISEAYSVCRSVYELHCSVAGGSQVQRALEKLDVQAHLEAAGSLVNSLSRLHQLENSETGALLCSQLREAIDRVQADLLAITEESQQHQQRWFSNWRYANYGPLLKRLSRDDATMETRLQRLTQLAPMLGDAKQLAPVKAKVIPSDDEIDRLINELSEACLKQA